MAKERGIRAGNTIHLRARFRDDIGDTAEASGVYVNIYQPDGFVSGILDPSYLMVVSGVPHYIGEGIFEYDFTPPLSGPDGIWYDEWLGDLTVQTISGLFDFEVTASGLITKVPSQLKQNNVVEIALSSGIQALDETYLEPYEFSFMTTINPGYTNIRKVRLKVGAYIKDLFDDVIQTQILEGSIEADLLTWNKGPNTPLYEHARREYVTCLTSYTLLNNVAANLIKAKTLSDLHTEYDPRGLDRTMDDLMDCLNKWEPQLIARGLARDVANPRMVIKGQLDPDRIQSSRMWESGTSNRIPAANTRVRSSGSRRYLRTHRKKNW